MPRLALLSLAVVSFPVSALASPDWCKAMEGKKDEYFDVDTIFAGDDARKVTEAIVGSICAPRDPDVIPKAEAARKVWSEKLAMTDADWAAAADYWATYDKYDEGPVAIKKGYAGLDPIDQYLLLARYSVTSPDGHYAADAASPLSATGRLGYAIYCVRNNVDRDAHFAACARDVDAVSITKVAAELSEDKSHKPKLGYIVRLGWYEHKSSFEAQRARREALKKADPAYLQMFKIAENTVGDWDAAAPKRQKLLTLVGEMDNARLTNSRKASAGCEDKTLAELRTAVGTIPAAKFSAVLDAQDKIRSPSDIARVIVGTPDGYLAAMAYATCMALNETNADTSYLPVTLGLAMSRWPGYRGPRSAVLADILQAGLELDERGKEISYPEIYRDFFGNTNPSSRYQTSGMGVVASVKPAGKQQVTVAFENRKVTYPTCTNYKAGTKITGIMANGQFERAGTCFSYKDVTTSEAVEPKPADARFIGGVKPGQFAVFVNLVPYATWTAKAKVPATILGVAVK